MNDPARMAKRYPEMSQAARRYGRITSPRGGDLYAVLLLAFAQPASAQPDSVPAIASDEESRAVLKKQ